MLAGCFDPVIIISPLGKIVVVSVPSTAVTKRDIPAGIDQLSFACLLMFVD